MNTETIEQLANRYPANPIIRGLIQVIPLGIGSALCTPHGSHDLIFDESGWIRKYVNTGKREAYLALERDPDRISRWRRGCDIPSGDRWIK